MVVMKERLMRPREECCRYRLSIRLPTRLSFFITNGSPYKAEIVAGILFCMNSHSRATHNTKVTDGPLVRPECSPESKDDDRRRTVRVAGSGDSAVDLSSSR